MFLAAAGHAVIPPAGTMVSSQSQAEYFIGPDRYLTTSNTVSIQVTAVYALQLAPPGTPASPAFSVQGNEGDTLYATFTITNAGNAPDSAIVGWSLLPSSTIGVADVILFNDANANGRFDAGEDDPAFLGLAAGAVVDLTAGVVLATGQGGGTSLVEIRASSFNDPGFPQQTSVLEAINSGLAAATLQLGPQGNAEALPGGDGSPDDVTSSAVGYTETFVEFRNDCANLAQAADIVEIMVNDTTGWPAGLSVSVRDSVAGPLPSTGSGFVVGTLGGGETRTLITRVSTSGATLASVLVDTLSLVLEARSLNDTMRFNLTTDNIVPPPSVAAAGVLGLAQTFRENVAGFGDVVTLVVTVTNNSTVAPIDNVVVTEFVQPSLNFLSSPFFVVNGGELVWNVGTLQPGEKRDAAAKFIVNSRTGHGRTKAIGQATALAPGSQSATAGPEVNVLRIRNDIFGDEGIVMGSVFVDDNDNDRRDVGEQGAFGVAVYLESGEFALTDSLGKFSIERAYSGYRVVRIDESTLPPGTQWAGNAEWGAAGQTSERVIHLIAGGHATVEFPVKKVEAPPSLATGYIMSTRIASIHRRAQVLYQIPAVSSSYFEPGKVFLKTASLPKLLPIVEYLARHPDMVVFLEGHTDSIPIHTVAFPSNYELGLARATAVKTYLTANGIPETQIVVHSHGESKPVATNATREGRARNRRVEVGFIRSHMRDADLSSIEREQTELKNISAEPDSLDVRAVWDLTTNSRRTFDVDLQLYMPRAFDDVRVAVRSGDLEFAGEEGRFRISGFRRSAGLTCEVSARVATLDSAAVGNLRAIVDFNTDEPAHGSSDRKYSAVIEPFAGDDPSLTRTDMVASWTEEAHPARTAAPDTTVTIEPATLGGKSVGIIDPEDGAVVSRMDQVSVAVCVPLGGKVELLCNDVVVPERQIGRKVVRVGDGFEDVIYYGIKLVRGWNTIVLNATAVDGTVHRDSISVAFAGQPTALEAQQERVLVPADGFSTRSIAFTVRDALGLDVVDGVVATVTSGDTLIIGADARPHMPGYQITSRDGRFELLVRGSRTTMRRTIAVEVAGLYADCDVVYVPPRRPGFLTGIAEARLGAYSASGDADPVGLDNFEDGAKIGGEARFFLQGTGYNGINLTARVDTRKRQNDPIFKSINPDRQYTIYGDASETRYAAPAERGNYVALEKGESFARYGDFESPLTEGEFLRYRRAATGVTGALVSGDHSVKGFVTKTDFATIRDEIPGDGTSGFYYLSRRPVVENSLSLVIEIRDRFRLEKVLEVRPLALNRDYTINYFNGAVLFKQPVPVTTFDLNPVMIVARYEIQTTSEASYLFGARGDLAKRGAFRLGATAVSRGAEDPDYKLYGVDGGATFGPLGFSGEIARSEDDVMGDGVAYKLGATFTNDASETAVYYRNVDGNFNNPTFSGAAHELYATKAGFDTRIKMHERFTIEGEGFYHEFDQTGEKKQNLAGMGVYRGDSFSLSGGVRAAGHEINGVKNDALLALAGFGAQKAGVIEFGTHWEQNLADETVEDYPNRLKSTAGVPLFDRLKLVLSHEYLSAHERDDTHQLLAGVEARATRYTSAYSKYSLNRTAGNERMGAVSGIKQNIPLRDNVAGTMDVEGFRSFSNARDDEYVAFKSGLNWKRPGVALAEGQYEYRWQRASDRHLVRLNAARQFSSGVALLLRQATSITTPRQGHDQLSFDGRIAGVYRPEASRLWTLFLVKSLYERRTPVDPDAINWRVVFSTDINVVPAPMHELRTKLAVKYVENYSENISETTNNYLVLSQYIYRFDRLWDLDVWGRYIGQDGAGTDQIGAGVELGRLFFDRVRVGAGYSVNGFEERDMAEKEAWERGFGLRIQLLLTDWILNEIGLEK